MNQIDLLSGWHLGARHEPSPNWDERPKDATPDLIVIHSISLPPGEFGGHWISDFFSNQLDTDAHPYFQEIEHLKVSAHVMIDRNGSLIQFVPFHKRAWHAGESIWDGRTACNDFSIGIELEGTDDGPFRTIQYWKLAELVATLQDSYQTLIDCDIVGHSDIAPGRKTDPGTGFDWSRFNRLVQKLSGTSLSA